jgi:hypothetical protein
MIGLIESSRVRAHIVCALASFSLVACAAPSSGAADDAVPTCANPAPLEKSGAVVPDRYMVKLKERISVDDFAKRVAAADLTITSRIGRLRLVGVNVTPAALARLRCDPEVQSISPVEPTVVN